ncbi:unnamed protein product [Adineta steineri]|uniref:Uncharacterized protein n=1 Tax=Adineta steineri TaxID=433720 RepID=A0A814VD76_9BILA|nr:unnamed protein product [Adineta steineri]CAF1427659.1 unnamed protein product [Adineta steineri]
MNNCSIIIAICTLTLIGLLLFVKDSHYSAQIYQNLCRTPNITSDGVNYRKEQISDEHSFLRVSQQYRTDKVTTHHYEVLYEKYIRKYVGSNLHILEIGLGCGMDYGAGASAHVWRQYLGPQANIYFLEFNRACGEAWHKAHNSKLNITMFYGSQDDVAVLNNITSTKGKFDVIVDDGGHTMNQQITSFNHLLPKVQSGGIYVIEDFGLSKRNAVTVALRGQADLLTSYMDVAGGGYLRAGTAIELIKTLVDDIQGASPKKVTNMGSKIRSFEISDEICFFTVK